MKQKFEGLFKQGTVFMTFSHKSGPGYNRESNHEKLNPGIIVHPILRINGDWEQIAQWHLSHSWGSYLNRAFTCVSSLHEKQT
jgi:hypothetical protein